jgi:hypothetical protein
MIANINIWMVGSQQLKCFLEIERNRLTQHKSKKDRPIAEGSMDLSCARAFHLKNRDKKLF